MAQMWAQEPFISCIKLLNYVFCGFVIYFGEYFQYKAGGISEITWNPDFSFLVLGGEDGYVCLKDLLYCFETVF